MPGSLTHGNNTDENDFSRIFQHYPIGLMITALDGTVIEVNQAQLKMMGYSRSEVIGRPVVECGLFTSLTEFTTIIGALQQNGTVTDWDIEQRSKTGAPRYVSVSAGIIRFQNEPAVFTSIKDITQCKMVQDELNWDKKSAQILSEVAEELLASNQPRVIVERLCRRVMDFLDCQVFFNHLIDETHEKLQLNAYAGITVEMAQSLEWLNYGEAICGCVAQVGCRVIAERIQETSDPRTVLVKAFGIRAYACHPLKIEEKIIGTLSFGTRSRDYFNDHELALMKTVANQVSIALNRIRYEEALKESQNLSEHRANELEATITAIAAGVIIYDQHGNIVRINEFARNLLNYTEADFQVSYQKRRVILNLCQANGAPYDAAETPLALALQGEVIRDVEMMINQPKPIWLSANLAPIFDCQHHLKGVVFVFIDITKRKQESQAKISSIVEEALTKERELLNVTLNSLTEGVIVTDTNSQVILMNEAAATLTGCERDLALGQAIGRILRIVNGKTNEPVTQFSNITPYRHPVLVTDDLRKIPVAIHTTPILTAEKKIFGMVTVFEDISEKCKTEQELLKTAKLESLGILAGGVAHDFNNILAAIISNLQLALVKLESNEDPQPFLEKTIATTHKASELTKQMLTFSGGGAPLKKNTNLLGLIKGTTELVLRGSNVKVTFMLPDDLWPGQVDEGQISQVLYNLVLNAKQAMPDGGVLEVHAANAVIAAEPSQPLQNWIEIVIQDYGVGIDPEDLTKIYDPFFTTKPDGNGLGLATVYSIINQHDGKIEVESRLGYGTTFKLLLPAAEGATIAMDAMKEVTATTAGQKILFMDDEEGILRAVGELLENFGYQVVLAHHGQEALTEYQKAQAANEPFAVVILDLTIPGGMGGQEVIGLLRECNPQIKAIVSSGYANDPVIANYESYGFSGVVSKPYRIDELLATVNQVIDGDR